MELYINDEYQGYADMDLSTPYPGSGYDEHNCHLLSTYSQYLQCVSDNYSDYVYFAWAEVTASAGLQLQQEASDSDLPAAKAIKQLDRMQKFKHKK